MKRVMDYQEGLIELPIYDTALLTDGQGLKWGADGSGTGTYTALVDVTDTAVDVFAVAAEGRTAKVASNLGTPLLYQAKVQMVDNPKVFKCYYDMAAANDLSVASSTSTIITVAACDDNLDGSWVYINSGTGIGQLRYVKAANATTLTVNTAFTVTPDSSSDFILIRPQGLPEGGVALDSTFSKIKSVLDETSSQKILVLKNFIEGPTGTEVLDITANSHLEMDGLNGRGVRFYSHIIFIDTLKAATGL